MAVLSRFEIADYGAASGVGASRTARDVGEFKFAAAMRYRGEMDATFAALVERLAPELFTSVARSTASNVTVAAKTR